jgi:hypothetical protein
LWPSQVTGGQPAPGAPPSSGAPSSGAGSGHDDGPGFGHGRPAFGHGAAQGYAQPGPTGAPGYGQPGQPGASAFGPGAVQYGQPPWQSEQGGQPGQPGPPGQPGRPGQPPQAGQPGYGSTSGQFAQPSFGAPGQPGPANRPPRRGKGKLIAIIAVAALVLAAVGVGGWLMFSGSDDDKDGAAPKTAAWQVGSCVKQTAGPASIPPSTDPEKKRVMEAQRKFEPADCGDATALSKIEALGVKVNTGEKTPADDGCPDNTDEAYLIEGIVAGAGQVVCGRLLKGPHPGDPGGGGGKVVTGDCVTVLSNGSQRGANDKLAEDACAQEYWAKVLATAPDAGGCTADGTVSRIPVPGKTGTVLCLGPGDKGLMPKPGDCMDSSLEARGLPPMKAACGSRASVLRFEAFADGSGKCAAGTTVRVATGYDRKLCTKPGR